jgi:hypothetical protein
MAPARTIPNRGPMSGFLKPFDVPSRLTDQAYRVSFSHLWNGIATRHSDTVDAKFFVDGRSILVGLAHTGFVEFQRRHGRGLTDREAGFIAAAYLRERLEQEDERQVYDVSQSDVLRLSETFGLT